MAWCYLVTRSYPILCNPMDCSTPGFLVLHHLLEFTSIELVMPSNHLILHPCFSSCPQSSPASGSFPTSHWQLIIKVQSLQGPRNILGDDFQMTSDSLWQDSWFYPRTLKFRAVNSPPLEVSKDFTQHPYPSGFYGQDGTVAGTTAWTCCNRSLGGLPWWSCG